MTFIYPYGPMWPQPSLPYGGSSLQTTTGVVLSQDPTKELERLRKRIADLEALVDRLTERVVILSELT